jgi:hypothetical protein
MEPEESVVEDSGQVKTGNGQETAAGTGSIGCEILREKETKVVKAPAPQPSCDQQERIAGADKGGPGPDESLQDTGTTGKTDKKPVITPPPREVERKTELPGLSAKPSHEDPAWIRRRTERDLKDTGFDIPYAKTERAVRDLVCSLIERQDRMNIDIFLEINTMQEDIGMLKDQVYKLKSMKTGPAPGAKK